MCFKIIVRDNDFEYHDFMHFQIHRAGQQTLRFFGSRCIMMWSGPNPLRWSTKTACQCAYTLKHSISLTGAVDLSGPKSLAGTMKMNAWIHICLQGH